MKQPKSFRLSEDAIAGLETLAERYNLSQAKVLEHLILDRSSVSDSKKNKERRDMMMGVALEFWNHRPEWLYKRGYRDGWLHFQTRHETEKMIEQI